MIERRAIRIDDSVGQRLVFDLRDLAQALGDRARTAWWLVVELDASSWGDDPTFDAYLEKIYAAGPSGLLISGIEFATLADRTH